MSVRQCCKRIIFIRDRHLLEINHLPKTLIFKRKSCLQNSVGMSLSNSFKLVENRGRLRAILQDRRLYCKDSNSNINLKREMDQLSEQFAEARELMNDARDVEGTVYFSEDMKEAKEAVTETLEQYKKLLEKLDEVQRKQVISTIGLRMEELKAQLAAMEEKLLEE